MIYNSLIINKIKRMGIYIPILFFMLLLSCTDENVKSDTYVIEAPARERYTRINKTGETILPNGRIITPLGKQLTIAPHPYGLVLSPDGTIAITANSGVSPFSISIIKNLMSDNPQIIQIPEGYETDKGILASVFMGLSISNDNKYVYVSGGQENKIFIFDIEKAQKVGEIDCRTHNNGRDFSNGYLGDMIMTKDGKTIYVVDQINFCVNLIDVKKKKIIDRVNVGRYPFGITLSPDEKKLYVANVGVFEYKPIGDIDKDNLNKSGLDYPAFSYNSKESKTGVEREGKFVPPIGDPNVPESFSVWTIDLKNTPKVVAKIKTGFLVGTLIEDIPAVGGSSPNSVVATDEYVFVSNGNNDCITVIDAKSDSVRTNIKIILDERLRKYRGIIPFGLALSPDKKRLYVAESGINAVGVIDIPSMSVVGHIPVGWFPAKLKVSNDGKKLIVTNAKGWGSGPNGGKDYKLGPEGSYIGLLMKGSVSILDIPDDNTIKNKTTNKVIENNFKIRKVEQKELEARANSPVPIINQKSNSPIKYVVFISKENRTYDEVFGQIRKGKGDPTLARYGLRATFSNRDSTIKIENADVMRNHIALAERFAIGDNFYVDSDHSADGHKWLVGIYPNEWVETSVPAAYGGGRKMKLGSQAPGNLALGGSSGTIYPEDYNEAGSIWDHFQRNNVNYFNFGFSMEHAPGFDDSTLKKMGVKYLFNYPMPAELYDHTSKHYPCFNMQIPDQYRIDQFFNDFNTKWIGEGKTMPNVLTILLPNDHGAGERPNEGYPFRESFMADNDLALGRIVEFLSHTPYWKEMAIIITEDDSQNGVDHIDAHRSIVMVVSPYAKKGYVSHTHTSFGSIFKTIWNILGIPYLNQYDAGATDLTDFFTKKPDFRPYNALPVDKRVFDPAKAMSPIDENFIWKESEDLPKLDDPDFLLMESKERDNNQKKNKK